MNAETPGHVTVDDQAIPGRERVLTAEALELVGALHARFDGRRRELLERRARRRAAIHGGEDPEFLPDTESVRNGDWTVADPPDDLLDRRVEITGPVERKMMINALNSGAKVFMADFEDATSPTWENVVLGQINCMEAVRRTLRLEGEARGKTYELQDDLATLVVRPRGWHLPEKHVTLAGTPVSASLFDFGLYFFHNARELLERGSGPYFYLPKLESHLEARLWNDVFIFAQEHLGIPHGTIRATVLIETLPAAFEMEEILYELRDHSAGLNAGRWDYIFSFIKTFSNRPDFVLPDRIQVTMTVPFMRAYTELLVRTCHRRGAHAIGGMAAFIPNRKDPEVTERALRKVREDKRREAADGCDGTWVAHPDLIPVVREIFDEALGDAPNQRDRQREDVHVQPSELIDATVEDGTVTEDGIRTNVGVAIEYIARWLAGQGAVAINNLMEDAATAEISRVQLWQWIRHGAEIEGGSRMDRETYRRIRDEELARLRTGNGVDLCRYDEAARLLDSLVLPDELAEFLTLPAYRQLR